MNIQVFEARSSIRNTWITPLGQNFDRESMHEVRKCQDNPRFKFKKIHSCFIKLTGCSDIVLGKYKKIKGKHKKMQGDRGSPLVFY